jgi:biotin operon repressor
MLISPETEVTAAELGALLGMSRRRIDELVKEGIVVRIDKGRFRLIESTTNYIAHVVRRQARKSAASTELNELRSAELELRMAERKGTLIAEAEETAIAAADRILGELRADLYSIPARVTPDQAIRAAIERGLDDAFRGASDRAKVRIDSAEMGIRSMAPAGANASRRMGARKSGLSRKRRRSRSA